MSRGHSIFIIGLIGTIAFLSGQLIKVENRLYAYETGLCRPANCPSAVETRTSPFWHLWYGVLR